MDRLASMEVFVKTAETGSFAAAAQALGMSSQMAGKHVLFLEARVGATLIHRTTRSQSLTEVGRLFYERCKALLADAEAAESVAQALAAAPRGRLRVTAPVTFGSFGVAPMVARYLDLHPEVQVDLTLTDRFVDLVDEGFEAAIRLGALADSGLVARPLTPYRLIPSASPAYLARRGTPATPADLASHECLGFAFTAQPPSAAWEFHGPSGVETVPVQGRFRANDLRALTEAATQGLGVLLAPELAVRSELASGRLVRILQGFEGPSRPMHVVFAAHRMTPKLRTFIDALVDAFPAMG